MIGTSLLRPGRASGWMLLLAALAPGPAAWSATDESVQGLIDARLELMDEVAAYKWHHDLPIEDPERERLVVERAVEDALRHAFTPASSAALFGAQIEAAKAIQRYWFDVWRRGTAPAQPPDLNTAVRPELLRLGNEILAAAAAREAFGREEFDRAVDVVGLDAAHRQSLFEALRGLRRFPDRLTQILETGVLRVGTTGDYAPFSHRAPGESAYTGIDIDLAHALAAGLGVTATFVPTTWPELLHDLAAGRYDVAMSGVSRTLPRQRRGYLSAPYYVGGKAAIARCADAARFARLSDIDQPGVRVVVNPGGTNEIFVDERLQQARKLLHRDNRTIFDVIVAGGADVMVTDRVEVELQASRHASLCATMAGTFTYQEKAYLMPPDAPLKEFVDTWLSLALADGTVARVFEDHGVTPRPPGSNPPRAQESNPT